MNAEEFLRLITGVVVLGGIALAYYVNCAFLIIPVLFAAGLIQSIFTKWCPAMTMLARFGIGDGTCSTK
ncbi:MAG: hypothetical protein A2204_00235 [Elusimicrobia bacterium RIFOXYA1_FULL_47_7]|nr:MAG: hypothetical protein A2204_00235 [Elusimicrobia bacterium RIFOXYA1_FULL_47_7]OGS09957.1 MAG: hypothetical protein A2386_01380 [Elusimicrobia bacterium RIFOXYB1_FULL_48_9]OGS15773.1 MAG: hypothetical protein A2251_08565 [Elusimicrobia bacterium RIFOXYA2_FULL_47_53]OGS31066.1 MAG: hypothetical protein A2323_06885 [Elusimicrobia bacterium RIFOXYB2_FULL_46_23]